MLALKTYLQQLKTRQKEKQTRKGRWFGPLEDEAALNTHRVITRLHQIKVLEKCVDEGSRRCFDPAWIVKLYLDSKQRIWLYEELSAGMGSDVVYSPLGKFDLCCNMWNYDKRLLCASRVWKYALNLDLGFRHYKRVTDSATDLQSYYDEGLHCFRAYPKWIECKQMHQLYESHKDSVNEYLDVLTMRVQKKWPPDDVQRWKEALLLFSSDLWYKNKDLHFGWPMKSHTRVIVETPAFILQATAFESNNMHHLERYARLSFWIVIDDHCRQIVNPTKPMIDMMLWRCDKIRPMTLEEQKIYTQTSRAFQNSYLRLDLHDFAKGDLVTMPNGKIGMVVQSHHMSRFGYPISVMCLESKIVLKINSKSLQLIVDENFVGKQLAPQDID